MPRKAKPFPHQGYYYTTAGGSWRKLCPVADGLEAAYRLLNTPEPEFPAVEIAAAEYVASCRDYYTLPDGRVSSEPRGVELALGYLSRAAAGLSTAQLTKEHLKAARELMRPTCSRRTINQHVGRIKRAVRWLSDNGRIPDAAAASLLLLAPLPAYRSGAKEHDPVEPVAWELVDVTAANIAEPWKSLILFQWFSGIRPGEACGLLVEQVDTAARRLNFGLNHKTGWRGKQKTVPLGANALLILEPWLRSAELRARPFVFATTWTKNASEPRPAQPGSYAHAVQRTCKRLKLPTWHPNQLRHAFATRVRAALGLEAAQHALDHARADTTQIYAERNAELARRAADACG